MRPSSFFGGGFTAAAGAAGAGVGAGGFGGPFVGGPLVGVGGVGSDISRSLFSQRAARRSRARASHVEERLGIGPLALLALELHALVDEHLAIVRASDAVALERPRSRTLEVDPRLAEARAVARALELLLVLEPVRRAAEVRARGRQRVEPEVVAHEPGAVRLLEALVDAAGRELGRQARLELERRFVGHVREQEPDDVEERADERRDGR